MKVPKKKGYKGGGDVKPADLKQGDALPPGATTAPDTPGYGRQAGAYWYKDMTTGEWTQGWYYLLDVKTDTGTLPPEHTPPPAPNTPATTNTGTTTTPTTTSTGAPANPAVPAPIKTPEQKRAEYLKSLNDWQNPSAQKVPTNIANHIQNELRPQILASQAQLNIALAKKYGKAYDTTLQGAIDKNQFLSREEGERVLGKDGYATFLQNGADYKAYRDKTLGTYDTRSATSGATDQGANNLGEKYGARMRDLFSNTTEQSAANVIKTPSSVLDYQAHPENFKPGGANITAPKTKMIDGDNQDIPPIQYDPVTGKPIVPETQKKPTQFKKGGIIPKGFTQKKSQGGDILAQLTPEQRAIYNQMTPAQVAQFQALSPEQQQQMLSATNGGATQNATTAGDAAKAKTIGSIASFAGNAGSSMIENNVKVDPTNVAGNMGKEAATYGLKRAGQGAQLGSLLGPEGTAIGAAIGGAEGIAEGLIRGKKQAKSAIAQQKNDNIASANDATYTLKNGGKIKGKGTAKSDSIDADIKPGSFVVPAENATQAERLRRLYLKDSGNAKLNQGGGVPVKLSNGEHLFSPDEVKKLSARGVNLNALAPNQENGKYGLQKGGTVGYKEGGTIDDLIAQIESEQKQYAEHPVTDQMSKQQQAALQSYQQGLESFNNQLNDLVAKYKTESAGATPEKKNAIDAKYLPEIKQLRTYTLQYQSAYNTSADINNWTVDEKTGNATLKPEALKHQFDTPAEKPAENTTTPTTQTTPVATTKSSTGNTTATGVPVKSKLGLESQLPADEKAIQAKFLAEHGGISSMADANDPMRQSEIEQQQNTGSYESMLPSASKTATSAPAIDALKKKYDELNLAGKVGDAAIVEQQMHDLGYNYKGEPITGTSQGMPASTAKSQLATPQGSMLGLDGTTTVGVGSTATTADVTADETTTQGTNQPYTPISAVKKVFDSLGGAAGVLALGQIGLGIAESAKQKAPVDHVDPGLLAAQSKAEQAATYGLDPNQLAYQKNQIANNQRNVIGNIAQFSGGNAGSAIANSRLAAMDANQSMLGLGIADQQAKDTKRLYADTLTQSVAQNKRQLYEDANNRFLMNQQMGSQLIGAGLSNLFGSISLNNQQDRMDERTAKYPSDPWANYMQPQTQGT